MRPRRRCRCNRQRVPRRRARVGGLCGFPDTAERVPAKSHKTGRCAAVQERWVNKIATLEQKKQHYEEILRRELDGLDNEFETLRLLSQELFVRANGLGCI